MTSWHHRNRLELEGQRRTMLSELKGAKNKTKQKKTTKGAAKQKPRDKGTGVSAASGWGGGRRFICKLTAGGCRRSVEDGRQLHPWQMIWFWTGSYITALSKYPPTNGLASSFSGSPHQVCKDGRRENGTQVQFNSHWNRRILFLSLVVCVPVLQDGW